MKDYLAGLQSKRLNEIVIAGSHDAGIYDDVGGNVRTQDLNIAEQAEAGVRFFDLRIATRKLGPDKFEPSAFHLDPKLVINRGTHQHVDILGGWGGKLEQMLKDAKDFVKSNKTEFLILKFSKSYGMKGIADACIQILDNHHFSSADSRNLNLAKVSELRGKVITLFSAVDLKEIERAGISLQGGGFFAFHELYDKATGSSKPYKPEAEGLQYFGKFSGTDNINKNNKKQKSTLMAGALGADQNALGMMYWTTTGMFGNIRKRNDKMWSDARVAELVDTWSTVLSDAILNRMGRNLNNAQNFGGLFAAFMPNIVMIDFASPSKCDAIRRLNEVSDAAIRDYCHRNFPLEMPRPAERAMLPFRLNT